jgi:cytidine deaminase
MERHSQGIREIRGGKVTLNETIQTADIRIRKLARSAWKCRENAFVIGNTKVGAAAMSKDGSVFVGCNVEHRYRSHDVHAEVNAITSMIAAGRTELVAIAITAERKGFTPCGGCLDWIFQFGGPSCVVVCQSCQNGDLKIYRARELMPHYPE